MPQCLNVYHLLAILDQMHDNNGYCSRVIGSSLGPSRCLTVPGARTATKTPCVTPPTYAG